MIKWICLLLIASSIRTYAANEESEFFWFKKGLEQFQDESYNKAVDSFSNALQRADKLQDYSRFYRAKSYLQLKNWESAQKDLLDISVQESHYKLILESRFLLAHVYFELKRPELVKPLFAKIFRRIRRTEDEPQVLLMMAKSERLSKKGRGCRYLLELYKRFPAFPEVRHWDADLDKNEFLGEPTICRYDVEDFRDRMRALLWAGLDQKAYSEMILVAGRLQESQPALSDVIRSQFHLQEGDVTKAYDLLKSHLETNLKDPNFLLNFASAASRAGDSSAAMGAYLHVAKTQGRSRQAQRALFLAGVLSYQFQDYDGAEKRFTEFLKRYRRTSLVNEVRWHLGWLAYLRGDYDTSASRFQELAKKNKRYTIAVQRYEYWLAMSYLRLKKFNKAEPLLRKLVQDPLKNYYQLVAQARLKDLESAKAAEKPPILAARSSWPSYMIPSMESAAQIYDDYDEEESYTAFVIDEDEREQLVEETEGVVQTEVEAAEISEITAPKLARRFETAQALQSVNLNEWAKWEQYTIERNTRNKDYLRILLNEYQKLEQFHRSVQIAHFNFSDERKKQGLKGAKLYWEAAYPKAFDDHVKRASSKESIPAELIWGIMKQESQFKKEAISPVGALGLMQVMPMTGYRLSRLIGDDDFTPQQLLTPSSAIRMGSAYLNRLSKKFSHEYALVAAAYNAGPHRVDLWVSSFGHLPADEFIEHIPFAETRNYVKKVLSNMQIYRDLYTGQDRPIAELNKPFNYKIKGPISHKEEWETP